MNARVFTTRKPFDAGGYLPSGVAVADLNYDGWSDIVVANECVTGINSQFNEGSVGVLSGNGDGTFQKPLVYDAGAG